VKKKDGLYIRGMAVLPEARGVGIGKKLLEHVQGYAKDEKIQRLYLCTTPYLPAAIHLYQSFGFKQISEMDDSFYGTLNFIMEKWLPDDEK
jgi:ribosomal protein S18 acetylase RimI-like enzyme